MIYFQTPFSTITIQLQGHQWSPNPCIGPHLILNLVIIDAPGVVWLMCVSKSPTQDSSYVTFQTRTLIIPLTWYYNSMNTCYIRPIFEPDDWHSRFCIIIHIKIATFTFLLSSHRQSTVISISIYRSLTCGLTSVRRDVDPLNSNWGLFMPISKGSPNSVIWETPILGTICHWYGDFILELLIPLSIYSYAYCVGIQRD